MSRIKFAILSSVALIAVSSGKAFALEDGWYHGVDVQQPYGRIADSVIYVEGDKPLSAIVGDGSISAADPQKIAATKTRIVFSSPDGNRVETEFSKKKNNSFDVKVLAGTNCNGAKLTFTK